MGEAGSDGEPSPAGGGPAGGSAGMNAAGVPALGGAGSGAAAGAGGGAGGEADGPCQSNADCSNGDASDGEEQCARGVCEAGNVPPSVTSITPADGAEDVDTNVLVEVIFSEAIDPASFTTDTVKLFVGTEELSGTLKQSKARDRVSFVPDQPLSLWGSYRLELSKSISDEAGLPMLEDIKSTFRVRDGSWVVSPLSSGDVVQLPSSLPVTSTGALLASWLVTEGDECTANGAWSLRGQSKLSELFKTTSPLCRLISASASPDGSAVVEWISKDALTQSFAGGRWTTSPRARQISDNTVAHQVFAHDEERMSLFDATLGKGGYGAGIQTGPTQGAWPEDGFVEARQGILVGTAWTAGGDGVIAWSGTEGLFTLKYGSDTQAWENAQTKLPGSTSDSTRSAPSAALSPEGDVMVLWFEGLNSSQVLKSSRFAAGAGWQMPVNVSTGLGGAPRFDAPALVFDGKTFMCAWTAATGGVLTAYTSRYDIDSGAWSAREPHVSAQGASAVRMPRIGADAQGNLLLLWAIGSGPFSLVYQRYRADIDAWGAIQAIDGASFSDSDFVTDGKLPFAIASNGLGGVMFRSDEADSQVVTLAQFF